MWGGADDLAWASKAWRKQLGGLRGKVSLWEGGLFGRLMRSPEAVAALGPGSAGRGVDTVSERALSGWLSGWLAGWLAPGLSFGDV